MNNLVCITNNLISTKIIKKIIIIKANIQPTEILGVSSDIEVPDATSALAKLICVEAVIFPRAIIKQAASLAEEIEALLFIK